MVRLKQNSSGALMAQTNTVSVFVQMTTVTCTSDTVRPTSHNLQRRTKQFLKGRIASNWLSLVPILQHFYGLGTCEMLRIIYIYFKFTIINIFLLIVQTAHCAKTRHVDEMD